MRKMITLAVAVLLLLALPFSVCAATGATDVTNQTTVSSDGSCQVVLQLTLHLEQTLDEITFPLPSNAKNISVNGSAARTYPSGGSLIVDLSRLVGAYAGDFTLTIVYTVPNVVQYDAQDKLVLTLPLLSGFSLPVEAMSFAVTLPGEAAGRPVFSSGYLQSSIESNIIYSLSGNTISGSVTKPMQDHETLSMQLTVSEEMFPIARPLAGGTMAYVAIAAYVCGGLALLYYLFFLRFIPPRRVEQVVPPEGLSAGLLASALTCDGPDLTLMVLSWAQLGYVLIYLEEDGRVTLHKRMGMGNERSAFERRWFNALFGKRKMVNATSQTYAQLWEKTAAQADPQLWRHKKSGSPRILRYLAAGMGLLGGFAVGYSLAENSWLAGFLAVLFAAAGAVSSWHIQKVGRSLLRFDRFEVILGTVLALAWLGLGALSGQMTLAAVVVAGQLLFGLGAAFGGRRSKAGKLAAAQALGLRHYLKTVSRGELQRLNRTDPTYFFAMAPYALALGVDKAFAKQFGNMRLPGCPYLTTGMDGHMTVREWSRWISETAEDMDSLHKTLRYERVLATVQALTAPPARSRSSARRKTAPQNRKGNAKANTRPRRQ